MSNEPDAFDNAEFYTARDPDELSLVSPEEAIEEVLDFEMSPGCDVLAIIDACSPITVRAYERMKVSDAWIESLAESLLDHAAESFTEEFCNPDGSDDDDLGEAEIESSLPAMKAVVKQFVEQGSVWTCEEVATRDFDADQVTAMMREHCPEWFDASEGGT